ncbi:hypothetical protein M8J77_015151 [Diaphorina citri]|nr:hypothetical protein M8J77_015151 [Diaphorina citri]
MPEVPHLAFYNVTQLYNHPVVVLTPQAYSQSDLNSPRIVLIFDRNLTQFGHQGNEETLNIVIGQYNHRYKKYWPGKFNSKARYDHEDYFHYKGNIVDVSISTSRKLSIQPARSSIEIDFPMVSNLYSNLTCATKSAFDSHWDLGRCKTMVFANFTKCVCTPQGGMFAVVGRGPDDGGLFFLSHQDILSALPLSYTISLLLYGVTAAILFSRWLTRHTSIVFLKLQCTTAHIGATLVFLYAAQYNIDQGSYGLTLNILEFLMLIALTCHVSTLLVIFTALTLSPRIPHIKLSIITIVTVIPVLAVLCNTLSSPSPHLSSWWLLFPSPLAYIYLAYALSVILLYAFLYVSLLLKLHRLQDKTRISKRGIKKRKGLLHRSCVVLTSTVVMEGCSIVYVNHRSSWSQWTLASSCVVSGLSIFCCYIVYTESTRTSLLGKHKACDEKSRVSTEQEFSSDSDPLHLFIKEDKDVENTSSPYPITSKGGEIIPLSSLPLPPNIPDILEEQSTKPGSHPLNQASSTNSGSQGNSTTESVLFNNGVNGNESLNAGSPRLNQSSQQSHMQCSPKSSLTPMKFVKFQDEILETRGTTSNVGTLSNSGPRGNTSNVGTLSTSGPRGGGAYPIGVSHSLCRTESGGEAVTYNNIILTVDPYSEGMGGGGDIVTTTRVCVELAVVSTQRYSGERFLVVLYGGNHETTSLNKLRYKSYVTSALKVTSYIAALPPTESAASQHALRTFYQVQQWLGKNVPPTEWGWKQVGNTLIPITTLKSPAPDSLLSLVACSCKKGCSKNCGCRRVSLFCSKLCANCEGNCNNLWRE